MMNNRLLSSAKKDYDSNIYVLQKNNYKIQ